MQKAQTIKKLVPIAALSVLAVLGAAQAQEATVVPQSTSNLTREEVMQDQRAWRESGMDEVWQSEQTPDIDSPQYRAQYAQYQRLVEHHGAPSQSAARPTTEPRG
ncbi:hypothetical protein [Bordetella genomosp. 13]|uniref:DUF4148 domain-containing protein n=1 Tax=Bordetella genomosp. 13 TaxID=463040 RepID=A0A1W6ZCE2_9BORD|nr:hypothetical protein [Bordetella genomosp. 13]ARP95058.1 hypothetical protein CAL15_12145 [Bordetella genomosp. 13]